MNPPEDPRKFFDTHHTAYRNSPRHARGKDLDRLITGLHPKTGEVALDVACGAGHTAVRLAEAGAEVIITDITESMLTDALELAHERHQSLTPINAPAERIPLDDGSVAIVTCRRAAHHFDHIETFLAESYRVLSEDGRLGISDMTASAYAIDWLNHTERLRDPSHHEALSPDDWYRHLIQVGFRDITMELSEEPMSVIEWLSPVSPESPDGKRAFQWIHTSKAPLECLRQDLFIKRRLLVWAHR